MSNPLEPWMEELLNADSAGHEMTDKQKRIFEAAVEVFAEKGYSASSTSEIAKRAGVAEGTIFRHYKTKKDLLVSIMAPTMVRIIAPFVIREFRDVFDTDYGSFDTFLNRVIENRIAFLEKNRSLLKILLQELPFHPDLQEQFRKVILSRVLERIENVFDRYKAKGQLADLPNSTMIRLAASAMIGYVLIRTLFGVQEGSGWDDAKERQATIEFIMKGLSPDK